MQFAKTSIDEGIPVMSASTAIPNCTPVVDKFFLFLFLFLFLSLSLSLSPCMYTEYVTKQQIT